MTRSHHITASMTLVGIGHACQAGPGVFCMRPSPLEPRCSQSDLRRCPVATNTWC
jgi:hypothetical protein